MTNFSLDTTDKVVSIISGLIVIGGASIWHRKRNRSKGADGGPQPIGGAVTKQSVTVNVGSEAPRQGAPAKQDVVVHPDIAELKRSTHILFIDDDRGFKIVGILKKMGWENTKLVTDISSLEQSQLISAHVVFVDIQGVGRAMQYIDEGLGLALAIKRRYPNKKLVIYSAEENGARFHEALQEADYSLPKTAEPIRFEDTIVRVLSN